MNILALDVATRCGWAIAAGPRLVESGVQTFDLKRGESPGLRFMRFRTWLDDLGKLGGPFGLLAYEQAHHRGGAATELCVGMTTRAQEWAAVNGAEHAAVHSGTLKKWATGSGHASKELMVGRARELWGVEPIDDNHGDALCLLRYAIETYGALREKPAEKK